MAFCRICKTAVSTYKQVPTGSLYVWNGTGLVLGKGFAYACSDECQAVIIANSGRIARLKLVAS